VINKSVDIIKPIILKGITMNLLLWLPSLFLLGLVIFALMFAFIVICERV